MTTGNDNVEGGGCAAPPCSPAFAARLHQALHAAISDPALRCTIYRVVENIKTEGTSIFWDSDEHRIEFVGDGWALEFHQENVQSVPPADEKTLPKPQDV